jgi:ethanolamine utilization microcompartment shell protein EutL
VTVHQSAPAGAAIAAIVSAPANLGVAHDLALRKAHALATAWQSGGNVSTSELRFDQSVVEALADFAAARAEIVAAKVTVDNP